MTMPKICNAPPRAGMLIESLRGLGYSTATAIADIVDNSISADARRVDIHFEWAGSDSWVRISDDGLGMDDAGLEAAMQLGARDPRAVRDPGDLGRFGMGLKTASFSQARGLTVLSHQAGGSATCLRWDLDVLEGQGRADWPLIEGPAPGSENRLELPEGAKSGTVVLWEGLDRIVTEGFSADDMLELVDNVDAHLAMTFQRLIGAGPGQIDLRLNGRRVRPWDPFLTGHPGKALETPEYRLMGTPEVVVQCHVLPHKDRLSPEEYRNAAGPEGWTSQQGVYIYRNRRLLAVAGWMRLGERGRQWTRDEPHRLARIRLDIPNSADAEWGINVLKSTASSPVRLRPQILRLVRETREKARSVFAWRGRIIRDDDNGGAVPDIWQAIRKPSGETVYRLSRDHDLVRSVLGRSGGLRKDIEALLRLAEGTVPVQRIWLDTAESEEPPADTLDDGVTEDLRETLEALFEALVHSSGLAPDEARARLARTRPFDRHPELVAILEDD